MANRYSASQINKMRVNPYAPGKIMEVYPFLLDMIPPETYGTDFNKYFRWVALVHDPASPMVKEYAEIGPRKKAASEETGYKLDHEEEVRHIAFAYLKFLNSTLWTEIICNETVFWEYAQKVTLPMEGGGEEMLKAVERQGKMLDQMAKMRTTLTALRKEFFGSDETLEESAGQKYNPEGVNKALRDRK